MSDEWKRIALEFGIIDGFPVIEANITRMAEELLRLREENRKLRADLEMKEYKATLPT